MVGSSQRITTSLATTVDRTPHARIFVNSDEPTFVDLNFIAGVSAWGADFGRIDSVPGMEEGSEGVVVDVVFSDISVPPVSFPLRNGFFGVVTQPGIAIDRLVFRSRISVTGPVGEPFGMDNLVGVNVPEPTGGTLAGVTCTVCLLACRRLRRIHL
jgi:hypothetical protein